MNELLQLLQRLHHDVKQPLSALKMFIDVFDDIQDKPEELVLWKKNLRQSCARLETLLQEMRHELQRHAPPEIPMEMSKHE